MADHRLGLNAHAHADIRAAASGSRVCLSKGAHRHTTKQELHDSILQTTVQTCVITAIAISLAASRPWLQRREAAKSITAAQQRVDQETASDAPER